MIRSLTEVKSVRIASDRYIIEVEATLIGRKRDGSRTSQPITLHIPHYQLTYIVVKARQAYRSVSESLARLRDSIRTSAAQDE